MKRAPFKITTAGSSALRCDGRFVVGGRASFVWDTFLQRRAAGVPGHHEIRGPRGKWHEVNWTIEEAEEALGRWGMFGARRVKQMRRLRASRLDRGLPVS